MSENTINGNIASLSKEALNTLSPAIKKLALVSLSVAGMFMSQGVMADESLTSSQINRVVAVQTQSEQVNKVDVEINGINQSFNKDLVSEVLAERADVLSDGVIKEFYDRLHTIPDFTVDQNNEKETWMIDDEMYDSDKNNQEQYVRDFLKESLAYDPSGNVSRHNIAAKIDGVVDGNLTTPGLVVHSGWFKKSNEPGSIGEPIYTEVEKTKIDNETGVNQKIKSLLKDGSEKSTMKAKLHSKFKEMKTTLSDTLLLISGLKNGNGMKIENKNMTKNEQGLKKRQQSILKNG